MSTSFWPHGLCSPPGSSIHGILQARILAWIDISSSRGSSRPSDRTWVSCISCCRWILYRWTTGKALFYIHTHTHTYTHTQGSLVLLVVKNMPANVGNTGDMDLTPGLRRSPGEGNGNPLQYSCLVLSMDRGAHYSPWGHKDQDTAEWLSTTLHAHMHTHTHTHILFLCAHIYCLLQTPQILTIII